MLFSKVCNLNMSSFSLLRQNIKTKTTYNWVYELVLITHFKISQAKDQTSCRRWTYQSWVTRCVSSGIVLGGRRLLWGSHKCVLGMNREARMLAGWVYWAWTLSFNNVKSYKHVTTAKGINTRWVSDDVWMQVNLKKISQCWCFLIKNGDLITQRKHIQRCQDNGHKWVGTIGNLPCVLELN